MVTSSDQRGAGKPASQDDDAEHESESAVDSLSHASTTTPTDSPTPPPVHAGPDQLSPPAAGSEAFAFDWEILTRPTLKAALLGQLGFSWSELRDRLLTLTQEEFAWQPAPDALRVIRRGEPTEYRTFGPGEWVAEWPGTFDEPIPRTIAWSVAHLTECFTERWEFTFGPRRRRRADVELYGEVGPAVVALADVVQRWYHDIDALPEERLMEVGLSQATEIDAAAPFAQLVLHLNRELIHHGSDLCTVTDLCRWRRG